jgi:hypothetical protein
LALSVAVLALSAVWLVPGGRAATVINSNTTYNSNTTWSVAGSPYILNANVTVASGVRLTVEPGVV